MLLLFVVLSYVYLSSLVPTNAAQDPFNIPFTISFNPAWNESYHFDIACSGSNRQMSLIIDNIYNSKHEASLTVSSDSSPSSIISYHRNVYLQSKKAHIMAFFEPTKVGKGHMHVMVSNQEFILPVTKAAFGVRSVMCQMRKQYRWPSLKIEQMAAPQTVAEFVSFMSTYQSRVASLLPSPVTTKSVLKILFAAPYQLPQIWRSPDSELIRLRLSLLFQDIGNVSYISKSRCNIQLYHQYDDRLKTEIELRITRFVWQRCADLDLQISKDIVVSNLMHGGVLVHENVQIRSSDPDGQVEDESEEQNTRIVFLMLVIGCGISMMFVVMAAGVLYFCFKKLRWQRQADPVSTPRTPSQMSHSQRKQHNKLLKELKKVDTQRLSITSIEEKINESKIKTQREREEEEEKALMDFECETTGQSQMGETSITPKSEERCSFKEQLDDAIVVEEILLDGIVRSMEVNKPTLM